MGIMVKPEEAGLSTERLDRITRHLQSRYTDPGKVAGTLTMVARRGGIAYLDARGLMDRERQKPMREDTLFRIYSMTKPITSVALMMLYEEGHFQLNDPVTRFIPEWNDLKVYSGGDAPWFLTEHPRSTMTIAHLLTHTSGLSYGFEGTGSQIDAAYRKQRVGGAGREGSTLKEMVQKLAGLPLEFSPGSCWKYSLATDVCGYLVEVISGRTFEEFLHERIFGPLEMTETAFTVPENAVDRFAACYGRKRDKTLILTDDPQTSPYLKRKTFFSGGGGLVSTIGDYYRFCRMLLNGGELNGCRILGPRTIDLMTANHLPDGQDLTAMARASFSETTNDGVGFGLGFATVLDPVRSGGIGSPGEYYWGGAASTIFWNDPGEDLTVIFMTQLQPSGTFNFRGQLKSLVYSAIID